MWVLVISDFPLRIIVKIKIAELINKFLQVFSNLGNWNFKYVLKLSSPSRGNSFFEVPCRKNPKSGYTGWVEYCGKHLQKGVS